MAKKPLPPAKRRPECITIEEAIEALRQAAAASPLGGRTCLCVCIGGIEYQPATEIKLDRDSEGAVALVMQPFDLEQYDEEQSKR